MFDEALHPPKSIVGPLAFVECFLLLHDLQLLSSPDFVVLQILDYLLLDLLSILRREQI